MVGAAAIGLGVLPAIFLRERVRAPTAEASAKEPAGRAVATFFKGVWRTVRVKPFLLLCLATFLMPSMVADVVDVDELETGERREGLFGSIFWWVVKLGLSLALAGSGFLLNWTGFDVALGAAQSESALTAMRALDAFVPALLSAVAIWAVHKYPIAEESASTVRKTLEARRGRMELVGQE